MSSYPTSTSATGIWQLGDIPLYIQDGAWPGPGNLGLFMGGASGPVNTQSNVIDFININSAGNATDFGDLSVARWEGANSNVASFIRGVFSGGLTPSVSNVIDFVTFSTAGNATDFGDLTVARNSLAGGANQTRGLALGGSAGPANSNVIDYITIASAGNATDFGDLTLARRGAVGSSNGHGGLN